MNLLSVFSKITKAHAKYKNVTVITGYDNTSILLKYLLTLPDASVGVIDIADESWKGYNYVYSLTINNDGEVFCEPTMRESGEIALSGGICLVDVTAIGAQSPEDFALDSDDTKIKIINID